ncbi:hypothetical protein [Herbidospora sp. NBRC 101105]|uniref:hypothetical protein n=1 Tax=Herbidospora sp. NBRC 101105 TaxID=3032195 RepID=UPI0024A47A10|nr:hypothetical protein [Herbidospora sp. NBRC 101105]GLX97168.1 hypothetical protein Hesp01_51180 [Herbidospora sp. NBRC 101105]
MTSHGSLARSSWWLSRVSTSRAMRAGTGTDAHSVWRDPVGDFGLDPLSAHRGQG